MQVQIIGTESLGVRGLCCVVGTKDRKVVIAQALRKVEEKKAKERTVVHN
jgi:predicted metallo-beta-lactamase superfamily hydrolase